MTAPLPAMGDDPSVREAQQVRAGFTTRASAARMDASLDSIGAAQRIASLWETANAKIAALYQDLQDRRHARLDALDGLVPYGPPDTSTMTPGDAIVMNQAWRAAINEARTASTTLPASHAASSTITPLTIKSGTLEAMLADAERFDDDLLRRAVLTVAADTGRTDLVQTWTEMHNATAEFKEITELRAALAGQGIYGQWNFTTFTPIPAPDEVSELPRLIAARDAARAAQIQQARKPQSYYPH